MCDTDKGLVKASNFGDGAGGNSCSMFNLKNWGLKITSAQGMKDPRLLGGIQGYPSRGIIQPW